MSGSVSFLATVDGDLRVGTHEQQESAVLALFRLFDDCGLSGHVTWFINELDFSWTIAHPDLLLRLIERGDALGVHDHFDTHDVLDYEHALALASGSRARLQGFCAAHFHPMPLFAHRTGCFLQRESYYRALIASGYRLVSDCVPGRRFCTKMVRLDRSPQRWREILDDTRWETDNREMPLAATPWRHDADNWTDRSSRRGALLHLPVISAPDLDVDRMVAAMASSDPPICLTWDTHPYNIQDAITGDVDPALVDAFRLRIQEVLRRTGATVCHVYEVIDSAPIEALPDCAMLPD